MSASICRHVSGCQWRNKKFRKSDGVIIKLEMKLKQFWLLSVFSLMAATFSAGQESPIPSGNCGVIETKLNFGHLQTPPVIFGTLFKVPGLQIKFVDSGTQKPIAGNEVIVRYVWRWFEYPYQEHPFGVWSDAYDLVRCVTSQNGFVNVPEYDVVPSGWYKGKYLVWHKPSFKELEISVTTGKGIYSYQVSRKSLDIQREGQKQKPNLIYSVPGR